MSMCLEKNWLQLFPISTQRPLLWGAITLPKCQLESHLPGGAVLKRILSKSTAARMRAVA